jgi:hypothetical protein
MQTEAERFEKLQTKRVGEDSILSHSALCVVCGVCLLLLSPPHTHTGVRKRAWWETEETRMILNSNSRSETEKSQHAQHKFVPSPDRDTLKFCLLFPSETCRHRQQPSGWWWWYDVVLFISFSTEFLSAPSSLYLASARKKVNRQSVSSHNSFFLSFSFTNDTTHKICFIETITVCVSV